MDITMITSILKSIMGYATPLALASLGGMYTAKAGVLNFSLEGIMAMGACMACYGSWLTGSAWGGALFGMLGGLSMALVLGFASIETKVNQVVAGTGVNVLGLGLSLYLSSLIYGEEGLPTVVESFEPIAIPILSDIPIIGHMFFYQHALTYVMFVVVIFSLWLIWKTPFGLSVRCIGDAPAAADSLGIKVNYTRWIVVIISGLLGGLGGASMSIGSLSTFQEGMIAGRGYLAWGVVTVGKWNPVGILGASLLFGAGEAIQMRLQLLGINIPYQILSMLPYLLTMFAVNGLLGKAEPPFAMGKPFVKGAK